MATLPPDILDRNSQRFAALLALYFHETRPIPEALEQLGLTLPQLTAWRATRAAQLAIEEFVAFDTQRAVDLAARAAPTAVQNLENHLQSDITSERSRRAAASILRIALRADPSRTRPTPRDTHTTPPTPVPASPRARAQTAPRPLGPPTPGAAPPPARFVEIAGAVAALPTTPHHPAQPTPHEAPHHARPTRCTASVGPAPDPTAAPQIRTPPAPTPATPRAPPPPGPRA